VQACFRGPRFGIPGIRSLTGVARRPLTCAALKPVGLTLEEIVRRCRTFAEGGVDLIKDDHYLADHSFCPFEPRVRACQAAVDEVAARTGHRARYVPHLSGTPDQVKRRADVAQQAGVGAVMAAPMLLGLPAFFELVDAHLEVPVLAHPSFGGAARIHPVALFGRLFRLFGADAVIFANYGGRFSYTREVCGALAAALRAPWASYRSAFPTPAGGMRVESAPELVSFFGLDTILLVGGSLLLAEDDLLDRTRAFTESVREAAAVE
jgi:ribulose-bisphosphate carboxylase large chain